ncbi:hypothetical protein PBY51_013807 [Eleginops maclovinus]|uniref:RNA-binding protein 15B n=1 Tax=Eleginops maclovinus TaxID=56733 RepID=A0AAN7Y301_ELEMC|nr:hypothetical protein PBY51_013807 [Eleginops maclovinus]
MKRQAGRESSPSGSKRVRDREHRREDPPLALLLAESRGYHRRSRSREKPRPLPRLREDRTAALEIQQHRGELSLLGRPPLRTTAAELPSPAARPGTLEYKTLLISNLGAQVSDEDVEDALFHEFKKFGDVSVKLSHTPELGRVAYVNFRHPEDAKEARHNKSSRLVLGERQLKIEPMYVRRRSVTPPDAGYVPVHPPPYPPYRQRSLSPPGNIRDLRARHFALETLSRERDRLLDYYGMLDDRGRPYGFPPTPVVEDLKPEDDQRATSNLFIGNLDGNVTEVELRRGFDKYGVIEDVVIKRPARGQGGAYAFVKFQNLDMAHRAKVAMQGRLMGGNPIKIGYGKANPTTRLWVGGLGPGNSLAALAREFDRFGSIRNIDYVKGDSFAYIQYESLDASQAACTQMRGFPLGGAERRLRVDFAKVEESPPPRVFPSGYQPPRERLQSHPEPGEEGGGGVREAGGAEPQPESGALAEGAGGEAGWAEEECLSGPGGQGEGEGGAPSPPMPVQTEQGSEPPTPPRSRGSPRTGAGTPSATRKSRPPAATARDPSITTPPHPRSSEALPPIPADPASPPTSLSEFAAASLVKTWHGFFALKNSSFPAELFLLEGGAAFFHAALQASPPGQLKIAQRLRMDQTRLDEVRRRVKLGRPDGFSVLLALQGPVERRGPPEPGLQARLLRHLVTYLRNKEAAGVVSLPAAKEGGGPGAMLYAFPPGLFSQQYLQAAKRTVGNLDEEHMVVVIVSDTN